MEPLADDLLDDRDGRLVIAAAGAAIDDEAVKALRDADEGRGLDCPREASQHVSARQGKLPVGERVARLLDEGSLSEDGSVADGVLTGTGTIAGRPVAIVADDPASPAGSWSSKAVERIVRIQERALVARVPIVYLVDSAGARVTEQVPMLPGRRGPARILHAAVKLSGSVPQVCVQFGPGASEGAYIAAFCDVVIMRDRSGSSVSDCGHQLVASDEEGIDAAKRYLSYFPSHYEWAAPVARPAVPASERPISAIVPEDETVPFDMLELLDSLLDGQSLFELHARWARELVVGFGRLNGRAIGVVASQPAVSDGMLFVDSADKAARFIRTCNAFNLPLLFLSDTPGFTIGTAVEGPGIIRRGANMISAVSEATVPKISVIVRRAYGAGLSAMAGPGVEPDACLALPTASIAEDVDILHLRCELVVDAVIEPERLRAELIRRFALHAGKRRERPAKHNAITPV